MLNGTVQTAKPYDIYARVSRIKSKDNKKSEPSTGGQVAICRLRLAELDLPEGKVLVDPGRSAWDPAVKRPAWDELMDRLERGVSGGFTLAMPRRSSPLPGNLRAKPRGWTWPSPRLNVSRKRWPTA